METEVAQLERIRMLNDRLRRTGDGGNIVLTPGIAGLGFELIVRTILGVAFYSTFTPDNDPSGEHASGALKIDGLGVTWKIDYYRRDRRNLPSDAADPDETDLVLTIMRAYER